MSSKNRGAGLGALLSNPAPTADEDPEFAAHRARKGGAADGAADAPGKEIEAAAPARRATGGLAHRGSPVVLPRERSKRIPKDKLTVNIPVALLDALTVLVERDGTRRYDEVEEALRSHLKRKKIDIDED